MAAWDFPLSAAEAVQRTLLRGKELSFLLQAQLHAAEGTAEAAKALRQEHLIVCAECATLVLQRDAAVAERFALRGALDAVEEQLLSVTAEKSLERPSPAISPGFAPPAKCLEFTTEDTDSVEACESLDRSAKERGGDRRAFGPSVFTLERDGDHAGSGWSSPEEWPIGNATSKGGMETDELLVSERRTLVKTPSARWLSEYHSLRSKTQGLSRMQLPEPPPRIARATAMRGTVAKIEWREMEGTVDVVLLTRRYPLKPTERIFYTARSVPCGTEPSVSHGPLILRRGEFITVVYGCRSASRSLARWVTLETSEGLSLSLGEAEAEDAPDFRFAAPTGCEIVGLRVDARSGGIAGVQTAKLPAPRIRVTSERAANWRG